MSFSKMMETLQRKEDRYIVLINLGSFYIARGKDAILLHQAIGLKLNCLEKGVCKVGFPLSSLEKYKKMIQEKGYSYIVYHYDKDLNSLTIKERWRGRKRNKIKEDNLTCNQCLNLNQMNKKSDKYLDAVNAIYNN